MVVIQSLPAAAAVAWSAVDGGGGGWKIRDGSGRGQLGTGMQVKLLKLRVKLMD